MYGKEHTSIDAAQRVRFASANTQYGAALAKADAIVLCAENGGNTDLANTLKFAPRCQRLVLFTSVGGSRGVGGQLGEGERVLQCESKAADIVRGADVELCIVRAGLLKGGGSRAPPAESLGLDASTFYDTLRIGGYPTPSWQCAQDYDRETLGVSVVAGDGVEPRSHGLRSASRSSHSPQRDEVSRINAALALLAMLRQPEPMEIALSAQAGSTPPTAEEWDSMLAAVADTDAK